MKRNTFSVIWLIGSLVPAISYATGCPKIDYAEAKEWSKEQLGAKAREYFVQSSKNLLLADEAIRTGASGSRLMDEAERCDEGYAMFMRLLKLDPTKDPMPKAK